MSYFDSKTKQKKRLSLDNYKDNLEIEKELYQQFLRKQDSFTEDKILVDMNHLENIFTNEIYYKAMKDVPTLEKQALYLYVYDYRTLNDICKILKKSKNEIVTARSSAIQHFKENIKKYKKIYSKKNGCDSDEQ